MMYDIYIAKIGLTMTIEEYEHDTDIGVYRFYDTEKEIATIDDKFINKEDIIHLG